MKLVIATNNKNKFIEIGNKFGGIKNLRLIPLSDFENPPDVIEDGATFEDNAAKKAREISLFTGLPSLADDSGLVVDALDGRPGVLSARYGGQGLDDEGRNRLLLSEMQGIEPSRRTAKFVCVIAIAMPGGECHLVRGECNGFIAREYKGTHGFGYDPVFYLPGLHKMMAELTLDEKNRIGHRARALDKARETLTAIMGTDHDERTVG